MVARIFPAKMVPDPREAEFLSAKNTSQARAPLTTRIWDATAVVNVLSTWKTKSALLLPWPSRVRVPVSIAELPKQYTPGPSTIPPRSCPVKFVVQGSEAASANAVVASF